jgi:serine/threonine-protein kinase
MRNIIRLLIYFLGFAVAGIVAVLLIFQITGFGKKARVPALVGKSISEAAGILNDKGLNMKIKGEEYHPHIPLDHIISQGLQEGETVEKGSDIKVIVSAGKAKFTIPYLEGMDINDVQLTLEKLNIEIVKITRVHSDTVDKNRVITQRPLPGHPGDKKVNLVVSLGPFDVFYRCPSFIDMTVQEARRIAKILGLKLIEKEIGRVIVLQKPEAGAVIKKGDHVEVTLGRGGGFWF